MFNQDLLTRSLVEVGAAAAPDLYANLARAYDEPHRHYHTRRHVAQCLRQFSRYRTDAQRPAEVEVAFWFHDAVYDTHRGDNEEASAAWAEQELRDGGAAADVVARVTAMIVATKTHVPESADAALLVDIDLGILGAAPEAFEAYDQAIRREYEWVADADYRAGRSAVLESFLDRPNIYATPSIRAALEARARLNLARKLAELRA